MAQQRKCPESLCLAARERAQGGPLTRDEILYYLMLLDDTRSAPDPDDPPSYDWTGGAPLAGGSQIGRYTNTSMFSRTCSPTSTSQ